MGASCAKEVEPFDPDRGAGGARAENGGDEKGPTSIRMQEVKSELSKDVHLPGRRSSEIHDLFDNLCSASRAVGGGEKKRRSIFGGKSARRSFIAEGDVLYSSSKLTSKLTGPWSVVIPKGTIFIGHKIPDTDAICSAIAAAELFDGHPAKAGKLNTETEYVLKRFAVREPDLFTDVAKKRDDSSVCLVDHNQTSQVSDGVDLKKVIGVIDHHAFQSGTICTPFPIYTDIRPWGSACTILAHGFIQHRHPLSKSSAGLMLAGIISDTLSLCSPTTTEFDHLMVTFLSYAAGIKDVDELAKEMFKAKSKQLESMNAYSLVRGDIKKFVTEDAASKASLKLAIGVVECTNPVVVMNRKGELEEELRAFKLEEDVDIAYLIVVDIVALYSEVICPEHDEIDLACQAFQAKLSDNGTIKLEKGRVSRKLDFMPNLVKILEKGWHKKAVDDHMTKRAKRQSLAQVVYENGQVLGRGSIQDAGEQESTGGVVDESQILRLSSDEEDEHHL
ncbi:DHHA2 domain-containing protein [Chloropicon primus]|uniref:inorganic diphosphatase n=1 Tax=Chloropicon primus TaxID=1764295 RepID=A0A5B8MEW5_9CHLO|nr:hypothetical protein A3770_02p16960 [Chloropicon primus]UPQ98386.1 DHHA2 domain-containing protein [Chloropicon primus]|mmetsp:Transcript_4364/g.12840  ORF Transcript_4364/g.12840 Transcript_4364/m.12840 type:complete len:504 (+) Transcript_4364:105-1616(+)|eukprot:QDZ19178.1 hypothetical protein A3770_02p16960 [Chloropicon primus]